MILPFPLPPWLPVWAFVLALVPAVLYGILLLAMPLSLFGLRGRIARLEARLDAMHGEIRTLVLRLPENPDEIDYALPPMRRPSHSRPPIPPAPPYATPARPNVTAEPVWEDDQPTAARLHPVDPPPEQFSAERRTQPPPPAQPESSHGAGRAWRPGQSYDDPSPPPPPPPRMIRIDRPLGGRDDRAGDDRMRGDRARDDRVRDDRVRDDRVRDDRARRPEIRRDERVEPRFTPPRDPHDPRLDDPNRPLR